MTKLKEYIKRYKENSKRIDEEIKQCEECRFRIESKLKKTNINPIAPKVQYIIHKHTKNPVKVYLKKDVPSNLNDRFIRLLGAEEYSKLKGDLVNLYKSKRTGLRYGVIQNK